MLNNFKNFLVRNYVPWYNKRLVRQNNRPVPLDFWLERKSRLRRFAVKENVLTPSVRALQSKGETLRINRLKDLYEETTLGIWALDKDTIALLWAQLQEWKPRCILECGSGVSTLMFARYLQDFYPNGRVISFEQDEKEKHRVEEWLHKYGLSSFVEILYTPLNKGGQYQFNSEAIQNLLVGEQADWLMIDGPNGADGSRAADMDGLLPYLKPGARWYADDSFRDGELVFLEQWRHRDDIVLEGIYPTGKGVASGSIK